MSAMFPQIVHHLDKTDLWAVLAVAVFLAIQALWKKIRVMRAESQPKIAAKIENVFVDTETTGIKYRHEETYAALAYSYSVEGSSYSGEIKLTADGSRVQELESKLVGQSITVHYNPRDPAQSMFVDSSVHGWPVRTG